ncbi:hypothetical protein KR009_009170 [Drosophila setifemur]|nr:hypothetical protein KR009_009170 [Drosophila setifemur]
MLVDPLTTDFGVCLSIKGNFGSIFLCSAYCQFDTELEPYLRYMDAALLQVSSTPAILGLDANAVSPMLLSKLSRHAEGRVSTMALQVLAGAPPLDLAAMKISVKYKLKRGYPLEENDWLFGEDLADLSWQQRMVRIDECLLREWQNRWNDVGAPGRVTYEFIPDVSLVYRNPNYGFPMRTGFLLTGHGSFNAFLYRRALSDTAACSCGDLNEDWEHMLCACPLYADLRDLDGLGVQRVREIWTFG